MVFDLAGAFSLVCFPMGMSGGKKIEKWIAGKLKTTHRSNKRMSSINRTCKSLRYYVFPVTTIIDLTPGILRLMPSQFKSYFPCILCTMKSGT